MELRRVTVYPHQTTHLTDVGQLNIFTILHRVGYTSIVFWECEICTNVTERSEFIKFELEFDVPPNRS